MELVDTRDLKSLDRNIVPVQVRPRVPPIMKKIGLSLGTVNYCLKALVNIGFIKVYNFSKSSKKINYAYIITSKVIQEKAAITKQFFIQKQQEYDKLNSLTN